MEKMASLQRDIELKIYQLKASIFNTNSQTDATLDDIKSKIQQKLELLEKEMAYNMTNNNLDMNDAIMIELLEKYKEIVDHLLASTKVLISA